ncbi:MAG: S-methyl-5'-thioadenosine phosphorylase [Acidobacteria bacterium]|nr:S-methyl-5'-thioadenosine phosphorylase [Acidobacteriota bacterium]
MNDARIGIIGGSGFYLMEGISHAEEVQLETPFGCPSDRLLVGELEGLRVAFIARHGRGHLLMPTEIPFRANIYALKSLGVERILSVSAVGSLQERYAPMDLIIPDQFFDRTRHRTSTFFGEGIAAHIGFADPVCAEIGDALESGARSLEGIRVHRGGTYLCMEGPAFSTKSESNVYRSWGMDVIGMTNLQEAKLAREAEICYGTLALVTDYDCWHPEHDSVTVEMVIQYLTRNSENAQRVLREAVHYLGGRPRRCKCVDALRHAILTSRDRIEPASVIRLGALLFKYFPEYRP